MVPEILEISAPCFFAKAMYIANNVEAVALIVMEVVIFSRLIPSNKISMSFRESIATPTLPTSPSENS